MTAWAREAVRVRFARVMLAASAIAFLAIGVPALLAPTAVAEAAGEGVASRAWAEVAADR